MTKVLGVILVLFVVYEFIFKDAFGIKGVILNHFRSFEHQLYSSVVTIVLPFILLLIFKESHVYTVRNLENLLIVLSIFVSILFGIMGDISTRSIEHEALRQDTLTSAIYISTMCLLSMILTFGLMTSYTVESNLDVYFKVFNSINFYFVFSILINTLLILKKFSKLIRE